MLGHRARVSESGKSENRPCRPPLERQPVGQAGERSSHLTPSSATHIWTPPVSRVELLTRFGTRLQSYIRPVCRASDEALALMDFRALRSAISLAASRALLGDRVGKRRSDRFTISVTQRTLRNLGKSGFQAPTSVFAHPQFCAPRSLNRGWRAGA